jgi:hypothetical protein
MTRVTRRHAVVAITVSWLLINFGCVDRVGEETERVSSALGSFNVLTRNYGNDRAGANVSETVLNTGNVATASFGKLFELAVDDQVYAGTLYASGVSIAGGTHNVVYVATVNNSVYAFDADSGGSALWHHNFNNGFRPPFHTEVGFACGNNYTDMSGNMGIVGTPVIDGAAGTLYVVTRTVENGTWFQRLRALDITTGAERTTAQQIGTIDPMLNNQRAALSLSAGKVYVGWGSHCDTGAYNGRMLVFDAGTLAQLGAFNTTPGGSQGGIWMAGAGPIIDASGNVFVPVGNGTSNPANNQFAEALLKLGPTLTRLDYFMPSNFDALNANDLDLGSGGPIVVPGTNLLVQGGKGGGNCYLINMNNLGQMAANDSQIPQKWQCGDPDNVRPSQTHHFHNAMVAWNSPAGLNLYTWPENDFGRAWRFNGSRFNVPAVSISNVIPPLGMPGGMMTLSANGSTAGTGVLWVTMPLSGDANQSDVPGILRAFDAEDLSHELWNSTILSGDSSKMFSKGSIPMVANGRVYVGSLSQVVSVYGLRTCVAETDSDFCSRLGSNCGTLSGTDNCGTPRTVASCGTCTAPASCGGGGTNNVCGVPANSDLTEGGTPSGTGTACSATETVVQAYDDLMTSTAFSKWCVTSAPSTAIPISTAYHFAGSTAMAVTSYTITTANDVSDRDPRDWTFQGCQASCTVGSDTGWITLDTQTGQFANAARYQTNTYAISNSTAYQQYRLRVTANNGNAALFQMAELQMFGGAGGGCTAETDAAFCTRLGKNCGALSGTDNCGAARTVASCGACTAPATCGGGGTANLCGVPGANDLTEGGTASGTGVACAATETVAQAYDDLMTSTAFSKWCVTSAPSTAVPISTAYHFAGSTALVVTSYTITTGNDGSDRDPRDWTFQGCQNSCTVGSDTGWITLDTQTGQFANAARYQTNSYTISNATAYQQYRLRVTANSGSSNLFQITELQFFGPGASCTAETDPAFCSRLGKNCGSVSATDNCNTARTVASCGTCTAPATCGGGGTANVCGTPACTPETDPAFCSRLGASCGSFSGTDNCGSSRTVASCGTCTAPQTCGGGGAANVCGTASCTPETDPAFCSRLGKNCGGFSGTDNCGAARTVASCGTCTAPQTCGGAGAANVCGGTTTCTPETDAAFCSRLGMNCGSVSATDNCSTPRTVASCGTCTAPQTCGGGGTANVCGAPACTPETDAAFCSRLGASCGSVSAADNCGTARTVASCGTCTSPQTCGGAGTANVCGTSGPVEVTEGGTASGTGTPCSSSETPTQAYDNQTSTKWCVTSAPTTAVPISTMYDFSGTSTYTVTSYTVTTANDASDRDPQDWTLQGCQGNCAVGADAGWVVLDTQTGQFANANRLQTNTYPVTNATAYQQYRLRVTANQGNATLFQLAEIQLFGTAGPAGACTPETDAVFCSLMNASCGQVSGTDNCGAARTVASCGTCSSPQTCGGGGTANACGATDVAQNGAATGTGTACSSTEVVAKAYDLQSSTKWCVKAAPTTAKPISTMYDFSGTTSYIVTTYTVTTANDQGPRDPKDWVFQGCQGTCTAASDTGWTTLDTRTGQFAGAARFQTNTYTLVNSTGYQQYRLRVTANNGDSTTFQVAEIQMFGVAGP